MFKKISPLAFLIVTVAVIGTFSSLNAEDLDFSPSDNETIVFLGGTHMVDLQKSGFLEASIIHKFPNKNLKFRDFSWEGDTVAHQTTVRERWRKEAFGNLSQQLERVGATTVIIQFGTMESFGGPDNLKAFVSQYESLIEKCQSGGRKVVLLEPAPMQWEDVAENSLLLYRTAVKELASDHSLPYFEGSPSKALGHNPPAWLVTAVQEKHRRWYDYWRPANWKCLFGDDSKRIFSNAAEGLPSFMDEWKMFEKLIADAEQDIKNGKIPTPLADIQLSGSKEANIQQELEAFSTPDGLKVNLFADESAGIANPLSVRWDHSGRMYVACSDTYPQVRPGVLPDDKIIRLTDTDGDGHFDESEVFASGLNIPTGMEIDASGVYVGQNTQILHIDWNGNQKVLLSGFGNGDSHQTINSFAWSPGGELWFCQGDGIESRVETPSGVSSLFQAGVFRLRLSGLELGGLLDDFMGPGNPWGVAFDDFGQSFVIDGAGGISYLTPASIPAKRRLRLPRIGKPGGYCGIDCIGSSSLPKSMQGHFLIGDYKKNQISRFRTVQDGAGFKVEWEEPVLKSTHTNFRPVDVKIGPDGAIYVVDWYNPITCHQDDFYRHPARDMTHGRIWRVSSTKASHTAPNLVDLSNSQLFETLKSDNRWDRQKAKQILASRNLNEIPSLFLTSSFGRDLLELASLTEHLDKPDERIITKLINSEDFRVRAYGARLAGKFNSRLPQALNQINIAALDAHPQVRMEAALAASECKNPQAVLPVAVATLEGSDRWIEYASSQATHFLKPFWTSALLNGDPALTGKHQELTTLLSLANDKNLVPKIRDLIESPDTSSSARVSLTSALVSLGSSEDLHWILDSQPAHPDFIQKLVSLSPPAFDASPFVMPWLKSQNQQIQSAALEITGNWKLTALTPQIIQIAQNDSAHPDIIMTALENIGKSQSESAKAFLTSYVRKGNLNTELHISAIEGLSHLDLDMAAREARPLLAQLESTHQLKQLFHAFFSKSNGSKVLVNSIMTLENLSSTQGKTIWNAWLNSPLRDTRLDQTVYNLAGHTVDSFPFSQESVAQFVNAASGADLDKGKTIFFSTQAGCSACHAVNASGGNLGPDLSQAGSSMPHDRITTEVLWPQLHVKEGFSLSSISLKSGERLQGYIQTSRNKKSIILRDLTGTSQQSIPTHSILTTENLGSLMPPTARSLPQSDIHNLLAFLFSLKN